MAQVAFTVASLDAELALTNDRKIHRIYLLLLSRLFGGILNTTLPQLVLPELAIELFIEEQTSMCLVLPDVFA